MDDPPRERTLTSTGAAAEPLIPPGLDATLVLVRHGESEYIVEGRFQGQAETPLSAVGRRQAERVADRLAHPHASPALPLPIGPPSEIVHSPLGRTTETAAAIGLAIRAESGAPDLPIRSDAGLLEIGQGLWEGLPHAEIASRWGDDLTIWRSRPLEAWAPGGESLPEVEARLRPSVADALARLAERAGPPADDRPHVAGYGGPPNEQPWSIVVGHDGIFKILLLTLFDLPLERFWMWSFDLCAIGVIEFRAGRPVVRAMNLTEHLAPLLDEAAQEAGEERRRSGAL